MGVSNAPGGVVDTYRLLLLKDGVGLLTAGGGPLGRVGRRGFRLCGSSLLSGGGLLSLGRSSLRGGVARRVASFELAR